MKTFTVPVLAVTMSLITVLEVDATITGLAGGSAAPAATLGPFTMTPFPDDPRPLDLLESGVPSPLGGSVDFSLDLLHTEVGTGWDSWSHGFAGDVYYDIDSGLSVTLTLPPDTLAFYLYAEPAELQVFEITAEAQAGDPIVQPVDGDGGAAYFGFFADGGDALTSITLSSSGSFAIGEFGIANSASVLVPEPGTWTAAGGLLGLACWQWLRRRRGA